MSAAAPWLLVILAALAGTGAGWLHFRSLRPLAKESPAATGGHWRSSFCDWAGWRGFW